MAVLAIQPFQTGTINGTGHFTQMIWANTVEVGCGSRIAKTSMASNMDAYSGVCNDGTGGNDSGRTPYPVNLSGRPLTALLYEYTVSL